MAPYDSDSSGGEEDDFTETNVLLGYASADANGEEISRLGGRPDWLDADKAPSAALARCKVCKDLMVLMLQLNAELPDRFPTHDRRLYVFACKRKSCRRKEGSIRGIRGVRVSAEAATVSPDKDVQPAEEKAPPKPPAQGLGDALFGVKPATASGAPRANPFATSSTAATNPFASKPTSATPTNPFAKQQPTSPAAAATPEPSKGELDSATADLPKTFAETLSLNNPQTTQGPPPPPEPWPETSAQPALYPIRWLSDAEYETLDPITLPSVPAATTAMDVDSADGSGGGGGGKEDKEVFESSMDATFQKFADRVGQNPEQCIRYEFAGQPLLYSKGDAVGKLLHVSEKEKVATSKGLPRCANCGAGRVFEVQLTPQAIQELECEEDGLDGMDWGTVIVGVCERDCQERGVKTGEAGYVEEWVGVQWEELTMKR
jgi:pre-rRNA-processing protein TSR4